MVLRVSARFRGRSLAESMRMWGWPSGRWVLDDLFSQPAGGMLTIRLWLPMEFYAVERSVTLDTRFLAEARRIQPETAHPLLSDRTRASTPASPWRLAQRSARSQSEPSPRLFILQAPATPQRTIAADNLNTFTFRGSHAK